MKVCSKCKEEKELSEFYFRNDRNIYRAECKKCRLKKDSDYAVRVGRKNGKRQWYRSLQDNGLKHCNKCDSIKSRNDFRNATDKADGKMSHCKLCLRSKKKNRLQTDTVFKFKDNTRAVINGSFKRGTNQFKKNAKTETILGCTVEEFRLYIESKFTEGMSFENHGTNGWHLDHIVPISIAQTEEEVIKLNHYTNFQPLWAEDNLRKSNKI